MTTRIAFLNHSTSLYGANRSLVNLIQGLRDHGVEAFVILQEPGDLTGLLEKAGAKIAYAPLEWWVHGGGRRHSLLRAILGEKWFTRKTWDDSENIARIVEILKSWNVDLVHSNSSVIPAGYFASRALNIPHIWHLREFLDNYGLYFDLGSKHAKQIINSSEACIAISKSVADHYFDPVSNGIKKIIYNGVLSNSEFIALRERNETDIKSNSVFTFGLIGHIQPSKSFDVAIRALSLVQGDFPLARLAIAGRGEASELKKLASRLGVASSINWLGEVKEPFDFYRNIDVLLMCSKKEAMGRVTVEGYAACKPVIGFDAAGTSEIIEHGKTGLLYSGDHNELAAAMRVYLNDGDLARNMGMDAWEFACSRFTNEVYAGQFYQVVEELLLARRDG